MFTGIVEAIGTLARIDSQGRDTRLHVTSRELDFSDVAIGDSIAVSGVCLTATELLESGFCADVSGETLACTTLGDWAAGMEVNLEKSLTAAARLGGHLVSGHVDGVGEITERRNDGRSVRFVVSVPATLARYIAAKGSICIDGVSLTVNGVGGCSFDVNIIPHTLGVTTIKHYEQHTRVNLEVDVVARYLERLISSREDAGVNESSINYGALVRDQ